MSVIDVSVPDIGDFTDVPVIEIHVSPGEEVAVEDPLVTLESDKATMDVPAPFAGVVKQLRVKLGDRVSEGSVLLTLEAEAGEPSAAFLPGATADPHATASSNPTAGPATAVGPSPGPRDLHAPSRDLHPPPRDLHPPSRDLQENGGGRHEFQVIVIGSGPGGYTAAFRAADLGLRTALIERYESLGGVCLNVGCIPSKALLHAARVVAEAEEMATRGITFGEPQVDVRALLSWKQSVVDRLTGGLVGLARQRQVEVIRGEARFDGPHTVLVGDRTVSFDNAIIAVGSQAATIPGLPDDPRIVDSTGALSPSAIPGRLLVIGGGIIGLELATVYDALGSRVTVVELLDQLIPGCDPDLVRALRRRISDRYDAIHLQTEVRSVTASGAGLEVELSSGETGLYDQVLVAVGRKPNGLAVEARAAGVNVDDRGFIAVDRQLRTNVPWIHAIGDVVGGPMLAHKASHEGKVAAEVIAGVAGAEFDPRAVPSVAYTDPEVAWMGLTETDARSAGVEYEKAVVPWGASARALTLGRDDGMTKLLFEPQTRRLLGAAVVGVGAGELIAETVHAIEMGADAEDIALTIHPHPTLTETIMFSAELAAGTVTDLMPTRRRPGARSQSRGS